LLLLDASTLEKLPQNKGLSNLKGYMSFSPDGSLITIASEDLYYILDISNFENYAAISIPCLREPCESPSGITFNPLGNLITLTTNAWDGNNSIGGTWIFGIGAPQSTPTRMASNTPKPTPTYTTTMLPGFKLFVNDNNKLTIHAPSSNSQSYTKCLYGNCTQTWSIFLDQYLQGTQYGYFLHSNSDISIVWTHNGEDIILAEWKNTKTNFEIIDGPSLTAEPGDTITLNVTLLKAGTYYWWNSNFNTYITILE
jgi:hypothetical protein